MASKPIGVTAAAELMFRMIATARSPTAWFTQGTRVSSSNFNERQFGS